ncbi:Pup--protein ligase [Auraticoccus sp. F435]|uniref:Pup--protein ligase n=1 Tax=Auraticoccus cholistanensis TaxID=2656650 RepID=A0A6A9UV95_9ACTN|nr:Pup--protein ligase [Auraticoccus cholistanensis]MVA75605.1 Pup--protein ligase [Auraticoccus cholistanensis]
MSRRIYGLETEFGVACTSSGGRRVNPDEVARYLFRTVVSWGRSSNVFLSNGARVYLDVGSHPEYATAECDNLRQLLAHDRAGEVVVSRLAADARERLAEEDVDARIYLFKNNADSHGNSYGSHENYLISREGSFSRYTDLLVPFLVSRQLLCGAGRIVRDGPRAGYALSQRAEHIWESVSSATTRSRPIINTRDEPHADPERYRRLHVIVGDSTMSETTTLLKVGSLELVLRLVEDGVALRNLACENPIRALRDISRDRTGRAEVVLANGRTTTGLALQQTFLQAVQAHVAAEMDPGPELRQVLDLWERTLLAIESDRLSDVETEIDWVIKRRLLLRYAERHSMDLDDPRLAQIDLAYHDIEPGRGLFRLLESRGAAVRLTTPEEVELATTEPPQTTRARLRGRFVTAARAHGLEYTVDWVHLKLNDQSQRTILCRDPFVATDDRVDRLIEAMEQRGSH